MASGGYRSPENPAPVSGPGALSRRTDVQAPMDLPNAGYGEQAEFQAIQQGAPLAGAPAPTPLDAPSAMPDVPVTDGSFLGAGAGPEALSQRDAAMKEMNALNSYMPMMEKMAGRADAPRAFRALVQYVKAFNG